MASSRFFLGLGEFWRVSPWLHNIILHNQLLPFSWTIRALWKVLSCP